jgi:hypothetical protein
MSYTLFELCAVHVNGEQSKRGARIECGYCATKAEIMVNSMRRGVGYDDDHAEQHVASKFRRLGWLVGKHVPQHRCPTCYDAIKLQEQKLKDSKIVNLQKPEKSSPPLASSTALQSTMSDKISASGAQQPRSMQRDEKRIIFEKLNEHYVSETTGYEAGWSDAKVATDLGVPRAYVAEVREEFFGPDIDERITQTLFEARSLLNEYKTLSETITRQAAELNAKAAAIEKKLSEIKK